MGETHPTPAENTDPRSLLVEGKPRDASVGNDIDARMEALLKDHQAMGARPMKEPPNGDLFPPTYPLQTAKALAPKATGKRAKK